MLDRFSVPIRLDPDTATAWVAPAPPVDEPPGEEWTLLYPAVPDLPLPSGAGTGDSGDRQPGG